MGMADKQSLARFEERFWPGLDDFAHDLIGVLDGEAETSRACFKSEFVFGRQFAAIDEHLGACADQRGDRAHRHFGSGGRRSPILRSAPPAAPR